MASKTEYAETRMMSDFVQELEDKTNPYDRRRRPRAGLKQHAKTVLKRGILESNGAAMRILLMNASFTWGIALLFNVLKVIYVDFGNNTGFLPDHLWVGALFMLHGFLMLWRLLDPRNLESYGMVVNSYGVALWALNTIYLMLEFSRVPGATLGSWIITTYAAHVLLKTGKTLYPTIDGA